jgi:hypothetical protein
MLSESFTTMTLYNEAWMVKKGKGGKKEEVKEIRGGLSLEATRTFN